MAELSNPMDTKSLEQRVALLEKKLATEQKQVQTPLLILKEGTVDLIVPSSPPLNTYTVEVEHNLGYIPQLIARWDSLMLPTIIAWSDDPMFIMLQASVDETKAYFTWQRYSILGSYSGTFTISYVLVGKSQ
jgi:hypothetical protein